MNLKKTLLALLLTLTLLFTLTLPAFATDVDDETTETAYDLSETTEADPDADTTDSSGMQGAVVVTGTGATTDASTDEEPDDATTDEDTDASADNGSSVTTELAETTSADTSASDDEEGMSVGDWISLAIGAAILLVILVLAILFITAKDDPEVGKNGEKVPFALRGKRFFRSCKSEAKKVVWTPWKTVRKNTIVVLIVIVICTIVIGLLDWIFSGGFNALAGLF